MKKNNIQKTSNAMSAGNGTKPHVSGSLPIPELLEKALQDGIDFGLECCGICTGTKEFNFKENWFKKNAPRQ